MPGRDVKTIRDLIHYQHATIIAKSASAASDGESRLKLRGDKKLLDFHPAASPLCRCHNCSGTADIGDMDGDGVITVLHRCCCSARRDDEDGRRGRKTEGPIQRNFDSQQNNNVPFPSPKEYTGSQVTFIEQAMRVTMADSLRELVRDVLEQTEAEANSWQRPM